MRLNTKIVVILGVPMLLAMVLLGSVLHAVVMGRFAELEQRQLQQHHERFRQALDSELGELERMAIDWSAWDDSYRYMHGSNPAFVDTNMTAATFDNLQLEGLLIFDAAHHLHGEWGYDRGSRRFGRVAPAVVASIGRALAERGLALDGGRGIVADGELVLQVGFGTLRDSNGQGRPAGSLVMLRRFDDARLAGLGERIRMPVGMQRIDRGPRDDLAAAVMLAAAEDRTHAVEAAGGDWLSAYSVLADLHGEPTLLLHIDMPRELLAQGRQAVMSLLGAGVGAALLLGLGMFFALREVVLKRLSQMGRTLRSIGADGSHAVRLPVAGGDEIDRLAAAINAMLDRLDQAYSARRQSAERQRELNALLVSIATDERLALGDEESLFRVLTGSLGQGARLDRWSLWLQLPDVGPPTCWRISAGERPPPVAAEVDAVLREWNEEEGVALPLPTADGRAVLLLPFAVDVWRGALVVEGSDGSDCWAEDEVNFLLSATTLVERSLAAHFLHLRERTLRQQAELDPLTGLANRAMFERAVRQALARLRADGGRVAVLFLDLDRFKPVNDSHGHAVGDWLLRQVAERIRSVLRAQDLVARLGGDEFTVLLDGLRDSEVAARIADKLVAAIGRPFQYGDDIELRIGCSIGIAFAPPHRPDFEHLLHAADMAMYTAKQAGRSTWRIGEPA